MRINVYSQELTKEVKLVSAADRQTGIVHTGVRLYLASPEVLHNTPQDDDRSAITFWIPHAHQFTAYDLAYLLRRAADLVEKE